MRVSAAYPWASARTIGTCAGDQGRRGVVETLNSYVTAEMEGDFVVFLTGMRINRWWKIWKWLPVMIAMPRMCQELARNPDLGMLHYRYHPGLTSMMVVQYWKSFDHIHRWATAKDKTHLPAWRWMNKEIGLNGDVGTWHETYLVKAGTFENLYVNMPPYGLGKAGKLAPARGRKRTAAGRLGHGKDADWKDLGVDKARSDQPAPATTSDA